MLYEYLLLSQPCFGEKMSFEEKVDEACHGRDIPGVVLAADCPGKFSYKKAFGWRSPKGSTRHEPLEDNATFYLASCTKLMTTVAAMQCVERGLLTLDGDVTSILPEFKDVQVLMGIDERTQVPILVQSTKKLTLRHLLTHTSGLSHPCWNNLLYEYLTSQSRPTGLVCKGRIERICLYPLVFEPGTSWEYGAGLEWVGKMIERVNGNISLQQYMETNIWTPLNMTSATFRLDERLDLKDRLPTTIIREGLNHPIYGTTLSPKGRLIPSDSDSTPDSAPATVEELPDDHPDHFSMHQEPSDDFGGGGASCSAPDFTKLLSAICTPSPTSINQLLNPSTVDEMFRPQLAPSGPAQTRLQSLFCIPEICRVFGFASPPCDPLTNQPLPLNFGLGGMLVMADVPSPSRDGSIMYSNEFGAVPIGGEGGASSSGAKRRRRKGTMFWAGLPNLYWWMDRAAGVSGFYASQLLPQGDPKSLEFLGRFEEFVYEKAGGMGG